MKVDELLKREPQPVDEKSEALASEDVFYLRPNLVDESLETYEMQNV